MELLFRDSEIKAITRQLWLSENQQSRFVLITGKKGTGKTSLAVAATESSPSIYIHMTGRAESMIVSAAKKKVSEVLGEYVPGTVESLQSLVAFMMDISLRKNFVLILDCFDDYIGKDTSKCHLLRQKWQETKEEGRMCLMITTSNPYLTSSIFYSEGSPFSNIVDCKIDLFPLTIPQIRECMSSKGKSPRNEDVLQMYMVTSGMPERVQRILKAGCTERRPILRHCLCADPLFRQQSLTYLSSTLGKTKDVYMSILQLIAQGYCTQADIEDQIGGFNVGGHLSKLEVEYGLIRKVRPLLAPPSSRNVVRFEIEDVAIMTYLRYVEGNRDLADTFRFKAICSAAEADFEDYAKRVLVRYFRELLALQNPSMQVGGVWKAGEKSEIDVIVLDTKNRKAMLADVQTAPESFNKTRFLGKVNSLKGGPLGGYDLDARLLTLADM